MKKKKNYYSIPSFLILFTLIFFTFYSIENTQTSKLVKYNMNNINELNHLKIKFEYISVPLNYLEHCLIKTMENNFEKEFECHDFSEINTIREFVSSVNKNYYFLTDRNKRLGYYVLYVVKTNLKTFSKKELEEFLMKFENFLNNQYKRNSFDFYFFEKENQKINKELNYHSYMKFYYGEKKKYDVQEKFHLFGYIANVQKINNFFNQRFFYLVQIFTISILTTFVVFFLLRKFNFKK